MNFQTLNGTLPSYRDKEHAVYVTNYGTMTVKQDKLSGSCRLQGAECTISVDLDSDNYLAKELQQYKPISYKQSKGYKWNTGYNGTNTLSTEAVLNVLLTDDNYYKMAMLTKCKLLELLEAEKLDKDTKALLKKVKKHLQKVEVIEPQRTPITEPKEKDGI